MVEFALSARSHFSIGESLLKPDKIAELVAAAGYKAAALCDTMTVSGIPDFTNACKKKDIKAIAGVRLRVVMDPTYKKPAKRSGIPKKDNPAWYPKLYARTQEGFKRMIRLITRAYAEDRFYETPRLGLDDLLAELDPNDLILTFGDAYSVVQMPDAANIIAQVKARLAPGNALLEYVIADSPFYVSANKRAVELAVETDTALMATKPFFYADGAEAESLDVIRGIIGHNIKSEVWFWKAGYKSFVLPPLKAVVDETRATLDALKGRGYIMAPDRRVDMMTAPKKVVAQITYQWAKEPISLPTLAANEYEAVKAECIAGWKERFNREVWGHKPTKEELRDKYMPRLQYELSVLQNMKFEGYFLLVQDIVKWSKSNGIMVGPGRGSVGGSLVAYLMGITDVDPIRFDLLFERFINPERLDLPDVDLDFMSERRHEVIEYITNKWGAAHVAGISNYQVLGAASAIRDVARVYGLDQNSLSFTKLVPKEHGKPIKLEDAAKAIPDIDKFRVAQPEIWQHASKLEGVMRSLGRHAAGVVVSGVPLLERAVVETREGNPTINWDKRIVEDMGLVKMDILGLATLDIFKLALEYIWRRHTRRIDLLGLPLNDEKVLEAFGQGDTNGVFQFESGGMKKLLRDLGAYQPLTFDDLSAATALYRPGPMDSGLLENYVAIKQGVGSPSYEHPLMKPALEPTFGVIVYQEQVMQVARDLCGYTMAEADKLRKAMGKKLPEEMKKQKEKFVSGAVASGMAPAPAEALWDKIEKFAGYAFNKSHSVEYSMISYQAMWLKVYYPVEFFAAAMTVIKEEGLPAIMADCQVRGIEILPPDINLSSGKFEILNDTTLLIPFNRIKGVSDNTTNAILTAREAGEFKDKADFLARVEKRKCNIKHQDVLDQVGAFARIEPGQLPSNHESRAKSHHDLLPGLNQVAVKVDRDMKVTEFGKIKLGAIFSEFRDCKACPLAGGVHPLPTLGKDARFMVVTDGPTFSEEQEGKITGGSTFAYVSEALSLAGLAKKDAYWTTLVKSPKKGGDKFYPPEVMKECPQFLKKEIELLKPPLIVCLGSNASRYFVPELRGSAIEHAGKLIYDKHLDASILLGISPGMIAFDGSKQEILNALFRKVKEMLE